MAFLEVTVPQKFTNQSGLIEVPNIGGTPLIDFDADTLGGATGDTVTTWESTGELDIALSARATGVNLYPTVIHNALSGHSAVDFGGNHSLATPSSTPTLLGPADPMTVVAVVKSTTPTGRILSGRATSENPNSDYRNFRFQDGTVGAYGSTPDTGASSATIPTTIGQWQVIVARYSADTLTIITADGQASSPGVGGTFPGVVLGANFVGTSSLDGMIARLQIYGHAINDAGCYALIASMKDFYGI